MSRAFHLRAGEWVTPEKLAPVFAFSLVISISFGELFLFLSLVAWLFAERSAGLKRAARSPFFLPVLAFSCVALLSVLWSVTPARTYGRFHRLLFAGMLFVVGDVCSSEREEAIWPTLIAYCAGATTLAVYDLFRMPAMVSRGTSWPDAGNMRDPQFYMVAICLLVGMLFIRGAARWRPFMILSLLPVAAALVLHLKRGVWISLFLVLCLFAVLSRRWKVLVLMGLFAAAAFALPQVRGRVAEVRSLLDADEGGRYLLWTEVAPRLIREYPLGMGYCAPTHEDLLTYSSKVQPGLRHLHNNGLQVLAELGWAGFCAWLAWMAVALAVGWRTFRLRSEERPAYWIGLGVFCAFCGLLANGMVEFNFGDSEILMLMALLFGLMEALRRSTPRREGEAL